MTARLGWLTRQIRRARIAWLRAAAAGFERDADDMEWRGCPTSARVARAEAARMRRQADALADTLT